MSDIDWQQFAGFAETLAAKAAEEILPHFRTRPGMDNKVASGFDPVTAADRAGERAMRAMIETTYPDHGIIGEEYEERAARSSFTWILDPIDGTRSFVCGLPTWSTLVALTCEGRPVIGVMHQPYVGETFVGSPAGSVLKHAGRTTRLAVSPAGTLAEAVASTTAPHIYYRTERQQQFLASLRDAVRFMRYDADAYFFCLLAAGQIDLAIDASLAVYDIAPLVPIIAGAGGTVETWEGGNASAGGNIIAAASRELLDQAKALLADT